MKAIFSINNIFPFGVSGTLLFFFFKRSKKPQENCLQLWNTIIDPIWKPWVLFSSYENILKYSHKWVQFRANISTYLSKCCAKNTHFLKSAFSQVVDTENPEELKFQSKVKYYLNTLLEKLHSFLETTKYNIQ